MNIIEEYIERCVDEKVAEVRDKNRKLNGACGGWSRSVDITKKV